MLTEQQKAILPTTRADLQRLNLMGVALLRGKACLAEVNAMAAMAKPGKTKHLPAEVRGVLAFESTLDRFAGLLRAADDDGILNVVKPDGTAVHSIGNENPADACADATAFENVVKGKATLLKDHGILMFARGIYIQLKAKYGEALTAARTHSLAGTGLKKSEKSKAEKAKLAFSLLSDKEKAELIASITGIPASTTPEPEVLEVPANQQVATN